MSRHERMNIKVEAELVRKVKVVAAAKQMTLSDYISGLLRPHIENDLRRAAAGLIGEAASPLKGRPNAARAATEARPRPFGRSAPGRQAPLRLKYKKIITLKYKKIITPY